MNADDERAMALQRVGGMTATLELIVQKFTEEAPRLLRELEQAIEDGADRGCERLAHTLKGGADVLALADVVSLAFGVERSGRSRDLGAARLALPGLRSAVIAALARIAKW